MSKASAIATALFFFGLGANALAQEIPDPSEIAVSLPQAPLIDCTPTEIVEPFDLVGPLLGDVLPALDQLSKKSDCPEVLKKAKSDALPKGVSSLCELHDRYEKASRKIDQKTATPGASRRITDAMALRFINAPDWKVAKARGQVDPYLVYGPAPKTWATWDGIVRFLDEEAIRNSFAPNIAPISKTGLLRVHKSALDGVISENGVLRKADEIGRAMNHHFAIPLEQAQAIPKFEKKRLDDGGPLMVWHPTECLEDRDPDFRKRYLRNPVFRASEWPDEPVKSVFTDENGIKKQCGWVEYAPVSEVQPQIDQLIKELNEATQSWNTSTPKGDPISVAAKTQRWLIGVHPFTKGNGRTSRFLMDWVLQSSGLPPAVLDNMDDDIGTSETEWAKRVGEGTLKTVQILEHCAENLGDPVCQVVSKTPPVQQEAPKPENRSFSDFYRRLMGTPD